MCLDFIEENYLKPMDREWKIGYKVMIKVSEGEFSFPYYEISHICKIGQHLIDTAEYRLSSNRDMSKIYLTGFHIFCNISGAQSFLKDNFASWDFYKICKVKYRKITAIGIQNKSTCIVAREMELLDEI
jgi:hypothetical protein